MSNKNPQQTYNQYLIRHFSSIDHYGITVPKIIAKQLNGIKFNVEFINTDKPITLPAGAFIVFKSGIDIVQLKKEIDKYDIEQYK